jgi:thioredoxin reductase
MLGRCRRDVVLVDAGEQRNLAAEASHGFLTRDGVAPSELVRLAREDLAPYPTVELCAGTVTDVAGGRGAFQIQCADGTAIEARRLLLATGVADEIPDLPGIRELYGRCVHHCPHCDAYEYSDQPTAVYGRGDGRIDAATALLAWTKNVTVLTDGVRLSDAEARRCAELGIAVCDERLVRLEGNDRLERIVLASGATIAAAAVFLAVSQRQRCDLAARMGCEFTEQGAVLTDEYETTCVPGLYFAGDASHREQMIAVAAAEGLLAAVKIHESLAGEERAGGSI